MKITHAMTADSRWDTSAQSRMRVQARMLANDLNDQLADMNDVETVSPGTISVLVSTQYMENYGAHDGDGRGECPQYWKSKGGTDYVVTGIPADWDEYDACQAAANLIHTKYVHDNYYSREYILGVDVIEDFGDSEGVTYVPFPYTE